MRVPRENAHHPGIATSAARCLTSDTIGRPMTLARAHLKAPSGDTQDLGNVTRRGLC
jgi:hypothetical protein